MDVRIFHEYFLKKPFTNDLSFLANTCIYLHCNLQHSSITLQKTRSLRFKSDGHSDNN